MDFYHLDEETPLLKNVTIQSSPKSDSEDPPMSPLPRRSLSHSTNRSPTTVRSSSSSLAERRSVLHPNEVQLSLDKVSFLYSPKAQSSYNTFHDPTHAFHEDELSNLDPYFDVTESRLRVAFAEAQPNERGHISYVGFKAALEGMGIRCEDDAAFLKLVGSIDRDATSSVSFAQFNAAVQKLKLVHLFEEATVARMIPQGYSPASITVSDFSSTRLQQFTLKKNDHQVFFTSSRPPWVSVRWINMNGHDSLNLKRLAIKYRLHPLAIEDTLEMHERPKFDRYEGHVFLVFPVLRMEVLAETNFSFKRRRGRSFSLSSTRSRMDSPRPFRSTSDSSNPEDPFKLSIEHVAIFIVGKKTVITVKDGDLSNIWDELNRRLTIPYSKLRHNDAKFLVYAVLDIIVDQVTNVIDLITDNLMELEDELDHLKQHFEIHKLRFLKNELFRLPRLLKPAREVLRYLIESKDFDDTVTAYIRDVHDHVVQVLDDIELQLQMCRLLTEDYRDAKANQMNYVIYTLTIVTTVFLPAQFLTGVYGMNFDNMPELHSKYGYLAFWMFVLAIAVGLQFYFRYKKWI